MNVSKGEATVTKKGNMKNVAARRHMVAGCCLSNSDYKHNTALGAAVDKDRAHQD